jgi:amyloid beta precursor protein binding protein 1
LRISAPFPALLRTATHTPFSTLDLTDHSHVPYPLILVHALNSWRSSHDHDPTTAAEKKDFKKMVRDMKKKPDEENFEEAEAQAWRVWTSSGVPPEIRELFVKLEPASPKNKGFYVLLRALKKFTELEEYKGLLPLAGTLPDMKSDTKRCARF